MRSSVGACRCVIGFTGGEPFINPDIIEMLGDALGIKFKGLRSLPRAQQPGTVQHDATLSRVAQLDEILCKCGIKPLNPKD